MLWLDREKGTSIMIELYTANTTNAQRASIAMLESGLEFTTHHIDLYQSQHRTPEYLAVNPNGTVPAMTDHDGPDGKPITLTQSVGIVWYLAEKSGHMLPESDHERIMLREWSLFLATDLYPPFAAQYFLQWAGIDASDPSLDVFTVTMNARYKHLDEQLAGHAHVAGASFSIADVLAYPMSVLAARDFPQVGALPNLRRWMDQLAERPTIAEAMSWFAGSGPGLDKVPEAWTKRLKG
jgi:GST-like protein